MRNHVRAVLMLLGACCLLAGCEGGHSSGDAVRFIVRWPAVAPAQGPITPALITQAVRSVTVVLTNAAGTAVVPAQTVDRVPADRLTTELSFADVPPGPVTATATAYPNLGGTGTPLATASVPIDTAAGGTQTTLTMDGGVETIEITPNQPTIALHGTAQLTATAYDADGQAVFATPGALQWTPSTGVVSVDGNGLVTGVAVGSADVTVTDTASSVSATAHITVTGPGPHTAVTAALAQTGPGANPMVRLTVDTDATALAATHGWLIYRAANDPDFAVTADHLIDMIAAQNLNTYDDEPFQNRVVEDFQLTFQIIQSGNPVDASVTASYNDPPLVQGTRYFYAVQRVIDPAGGVEVMAHSRQILPVVPVLTLAPDNSILSYPSTVAGPLTFFLPPVLSSPNDNASNQPTDITFTWQPSLGADEYVVQVFPNSDPTGIHAPVLQSDVVQDAGSGVLNTVIQGFSVNTTYWWRVGARQSADPAKPINLTTGEKQWLYSAMGRFTTQ